MDKGLLNIKNKYAFRNLTDFDFSWEITGNGNVVKTGRFDNVQASPGEVVQVSFDPEINPETGVEYFITVKATLKNQDGLLDAGTELAAEQFKLPSFTPPKKMNLANLPSVSVDESNNLVRVKGAGFEITFDKEAGTISSYKKGETEMLQQGPVPNFWRAPIDNDFGNNLHIRSRVWREAGKNRKVVTTAVNRKANNLAEVTFVFNIVDEKEEKIADYTSVYAVYGSGDVMVDNHFRMSKPDLPEIVRMGMNLIMSRQFNQMAWLGRGPHESYQDRKTSAFINLYKGSVADQYWAYLRPQENGNKTDVRWTAVTDANGNGLYFEGMPLLEVSAHHNLLEDFESPGRTDGRQREGETVVNRHTTDVKPRDLTSVNIDYKQMGVGGDNSWGAWTHDQYRLREKEYRYSFRM
ncbi:MAG: beta-galactosidase small subunit family protein, partial [Mariniphaga sp.]